MSGTQLIEHSKAIDQTDLPLNGNIAYSLEKTKGKEKFYYSLVIHNCEFFVRQVPKFLFVFANPFRNFESQKGNGWGQNFEGFGFLSISRFLLNNKRARLQLL